jgi:hypothetical protein
MATLQMLFENWSNKVHIELFQISLYSRTTFWHVSVAAITVIREVHLQRITGVPRNFFFGVGGSTKLVEDGGQRERVPGSGSPLVRGSTQFANEWNPYSN